MKTAYGNIATFSVIILIALLLFSPMRAGLEDYIYAQPQSLRMDLGDSYDISYTLDAERQQKVTFSSADSSIAHVNQQGTVTALASGKTQIRLTAEGGAKTAVNIEVIGKPVATMTLNTSSMDLEKGQVSGLRAIFNEGALDTRVKWESADNDVATVDAIGRVSAVGGGFTRITATTPGGLTAHADVKVHVTGTAVQITPNEVTVGSGAVLRLGTYYFPEDTTDEIDHWASSDTAVLKVSSDGTIRAVGNGQAALSVFTKGGLSASTLITVEQSANDFEISPSAMTVERGQVITLEPRFLDASGEVSDQYSEHYIAWNSSNPDVATVENGVVTALASGMTRVTAEADGMTASCIVRVEVLVHEVQLNLEEVYLLKEQTSEPIPLSAVISPADPDDPTITFTSDNPQVASMTEDGYVVMTGAYGTAVITARAASGAEDRFIVNVVTQIPDLSETPPDEADTIEEAEPENVVHLF